MSQRKERKESDEADLKRWLSNAKKVVLVGIGNPLRKDDFVGLKIIRNLENIVPESVLLIEGETVPESFIAPIVDFNPTHILIIDAAVLSLKSGSFKLLKARQIARYSTISTHTLPLRTFCDYLSRTTDAAIALLAIQPQNTSFGDGHPDC